MNKEEKLQQRAANTLTNIVKPSDTESGLKQSYIDYKSQPRKKQREADWDMLATHGKTNKERYEELESEYLKNDLDDDNQLSYDGTGMTSYISEILGEKAIHEEAEDNNSINFTDINYPPEAVEAALQWSHNAMRTIIVPTNTLEQLEDLWINFRSMIRKNQRESDWKSEELFGVNNETHYQYLKSSLVKKDLHPDNTTIIEPESGLAPVGSDIEMECRLIKYINNPIVLAEKCMGLHNKKDKTYYEDTLIKSIIDDTVAYFDNNIGAPTDLNIDDLPFFDPEEMLDLGVHGYKTNYYSNTPDNANLAPLVTTEQWFQSYKMLFNGIITKEMTEYTKLRINKLRELYLDFDSIKESEDMDKINARKQSILELGWNPEIPFSPKNRIAANARIKSILKEKYNLTIIDTGEIVKNLSENNTTANSDEFVYMVSLINDEGKLILGFSYDSSLKELYKYDTNIADGISKYSIDNYDKNTTIQVFGIAIKEKDLITLRENLKSYMENKDPILDRVDSIADADIRIVASIFISKLLKESTVVPKYIYRLYNGPLSQYSYGKMNSFMASLLSNTTVNESYKVTNSDILLESVYDNADNLSNLKNIFENNLDNLDETAQKIYNSLIKPYTNIKYVHEVKEFPVQFDNEGNLLIRAIKRLNFREEYGQSHRLLMQYAKVKNLEGMKYELSKLWFLNKVLEHKLYTKKEKKDREELFKVRAFILNDFNKYFDIVITEDRNFNFSVYFDNTPFSDAVYKISGSTLEYTGRAIKDIITGLFK